MVEMRVKGGATKIVLLCLIILVVAPRVTYGYLNATLTSMGGDLSVTVFLPKNINNASEDAYYQSSRFEHGSMIGNIRRVIRDSAGTPTAVHTLYGTELWRVPHDPQWPESGVGLASEFGAGEDGPLCTYRCGWNGASSVTNGLLGYKEARIGEPFIKIGVGVLVKGTCADCDVSENYLFNSAYKFAEAPNWTYQKPSANTIILENGALLHSKNLFGYHLRKEISLTDNVLSVKSTLTNWGEEAFTTPWYSHHLFSCDAQHIGPGYKVELGLKPTPTGTNMGSLYDEPGLMWWSTPVRGYAKLSSLNGDAVEVQMFREVEDGKRIKVEFVKDDTTRGSFVLKGCDTSIKEEIPEVADPASGINMYAFNLYIERGTLSPEPLLLLHLEPGKSLSWTQVLQIDNATPPPTPLGATPANTLTAFLSTSLAENGDNSMLRPLESITTSQLYVICVVLAITVGCAVKLWRRSNKRRKNYSLLSDVQMADCNLPSSQ